VDRRHGTPLSPLHNPFPLLMAKPFFVSFAFVVAFPSPTLTSQKKILAFPTRVV
jgi:hypothetical protein